MWRTAWRGLVAHKLRLALTALVIVLGTSFVSGTLVLTDTMSHTFDDLFADVSSGVDVAVRAPSVFRGGHDAFGERELVPASVVQSVRGVAGVKAAEGKVSGYAQLVGGDGKAIAAGGPTLGVNWATVPGLGPLRLRRGRAPTGAGDAVVDALTAEKHHLRIGQRVKILFQGPAEDFTLTGITGFGSADNLAGATLVAFETSTAQRVLGRSGRFDAVDAQARSGIGQGELRARIARALPKSLEAVTGRQVARENASSVKKNLGVFRTALLVFAGISLFVGAFLIFNTFSILVAQRTREMGILRALGASRAQVTRSVLVEALIVGTIASAVGLGLGFLVAAGLQGLLGKFGIDLPSSTTQFLPHTAVAAMALGVGVTCVASFVPARRAARTPPMAALRDVPAPPSSLRRRLLVGAAVTALGMAVGVFGLFGHPGQPAAVVGLGIAATFMGIAVLSPLFARPMAGVIGAPLGRLLGVPGKLARANATRNPRRTASTALALMIGLGLVSTVTVLAASVKASVADQLDRSLGADYVIGAKQFIGFSTDLVTQLQGRPGIETVTSVRTGDWRYGQASKSLAAVNPDALGSLIRVDAGSRGAQALRSGELLVWAKDARDHHWRVGQTIAMRFARTGVRRVRIGGTFARRDFGTYLVSSAFYEANYTTVLDYIVLVRAKPGVPSAVSKASVDKAAAASPNVEVRDRAEFKRSQQDQVGQALALIYALLGLAVLIALLGIVNTLALSVLERTRELGVVRAVGMSRRQVRRMIRWEAVIIAVLGAVLGLVVGVVFGLALVRALHDQGLTVSVVPVASLAGFVLLAAGAGVVAAIPPARRAARLDVLAAIAYE